jgi:hypothetical protein
MRERYYALSRAVSRYLAVLTLPPLLGPCPQGRHEDCVSLCSEIHPINCGWLLFVTPVAILFPASQ